MRGTRLGGLLAALGVVASAAGVAGATAALADEGVAAVSFDGESGVLTGATDSAGASVAGASARRGTGGLRIAATAAGATATPATVAITPRAATRPPSRVPLTAHHSSPTSAEAAESTTLSGQIKC